MRFGLRTRKWERIAVTKHKIVTSAALGGERAHKRDETSGAITPGVNHGKYDTAVNSKGGKPAKEIRGRGYDEGKEKGVAGAQRRNGRGHG